MKYSIAKAVVIFLSFLSFVSCDKDFNSLGSDLIDGNHFVLEKYPVQNLTAYSKATGPVQSNNLPINALGIYKDPYFGTTKAHFVSQVELSTANPTIGYQPEIDSVYLYVPYYSTYKSVTDAGERIYELDSVYDYSETAKFILHVYENGYYLRDYDPGDDFESAQKYYSNEKSLVDAYKGTELLNNSTKLSQNEEFIFSNKEIYIYKTNGSGQYLDANGAVLANQTDPTLRVIKERKLPGMWLDLKNSFFQQKILNASTSGALFNNNAFKEYFRGLLFEVEAISPDQGALAMLDFSTAEFKIIYKAAALAPTTEVPNPTKTRRVLTLQMGYKSTGNKKANSINFIEHARSNVYQTKLAASNEVTGDNRLYLKGGNGSVAFIDVFGPDVKKVVDDVLVSDPNGNGVPDELDELRINMKLYQWLVNEANLVFYVDKDAMSASYQNEAERIYVFDATNHKPILDYYADNSTGSNFKKNKSSFGGIVERETLADEFNRKRGIKYKVRITEYIRQLIKNENTDYDDNVRLGVAVIEDINSPANAYVNPANPITIGTSNVPFIPVSSVMSPLGTVLYGTNIPAGDPNVAKKLKLEIYFTKPNQ
ncbi:MAG: DUF4270 domain-containing protein [Flavobacterium sp.]